MIYLFFNLLFDFEFVAVLIILVLIGYILGKSLKPDITLPVILVVAVVLAILVSRWNDLWYLFGTQSRAVVSLFVGIFSVGIMLVPAKLAQRNLTQPKKKDQEEEVIK